jgi:hypothetical protein
VVRLWDPGIDEDDAGIVLVRLTDIGANEDRDTPPVATLEAKEDVPANESS